MCLRVILCARLRGGITVRSFDESGSWSEAYFFESVWCLYEVLIWVRKDLSNVVHTKFTIVFDANETDAEVVLCSFSPHDDLVAGVILGGRMRICSGEQCSGYQIEYFSCGYDVFL